MKQPSTSFQEVIPAGEAEKFENYAQKLKLIQRAKSQKYGKGRLLHRKGLLALKAGGTTVLMVSHDLEQVREVK